MRIKGTRLTFVPSFGASVKLLLVFVVVVWVTIYGMCNLFKKGGEISYLLGSMNLFAKLRVLLKYVANTLSHVSVISFVHKKGISMIQNLNLLMNV